MSFNNYLVIPGDSAVCYTDDHQPSARRAMWPGGFQERPRKKSPRMLGIKVHQRTLVPER